jgi:hypothetical protein
MNDPTYTPPENDKGAPPALRVLHIAILLTMTYALAFSPTLDEPWYNVTVFGFWIMGALTLVAAASNVGSVSDAAKLLDRLPDPLVTEAAPETRRDRDARIKAANIVAKASSLTFSAFLVLAGYYVVLIAAAARSHYGKATLCLAAAILWTMLCVYARDALKRYTVKVDAEAARVKAGDAK